MSHNRIMAAAGSASGTPDASAIDFAYEVAAEKLAAQLDLIDKLDAKLGVVIGAVVAVAAVYASTSKDALAALVLLVPAAASAIGYGSRNWANPPNPIKLTTYANLGKQEMQEQALAVILQALPDNDEELRKKAAWFNRSLWLSLAALLVLIVLTAVLPKPS